MSRYIDADKLLELFEQNDDVFKSQDIRHIISKTATADVVEVKYIKDIWKDINEHCEFACSLCGCIIYEVIGDEKTDGGRFNFCPNCGAKNVGEGEDE